MLDPDNVPKPAPKEKSIFLKFLEAAIYSELKRPVPAISLNPKAICGKFSFF